MTLDQFHQMLRPAQKRLSRCRLTAHLTTLLNYGTSWILVICLLVAVNNFLLARVTGITVPQLWIALSIVSVVCMGGGCLVYRLFNAVEYTTVIDRLDQVSNRHNMILTAYELIKAGSNSGFAQIAIRHGIDRLNAVSLNTLSLPQPAVKRAVGTACCFAIVLSFWSTGAAAKKTMPRPADRVTDEVLVIHPEHLPETSHGGHKRKTALSDDVSSYPERGPLSHAFNTDMAGQADAGISRSVGKSRRKHDSASSEKAGFTPTESMRDSLEKAHASGRGSALTPPAETAIKIEFLSINASLNEDQHPAPVREKDPRSSVAASSRRPFTESRRAAPGRELGRSGKKGKPGQGRGGLGSVKKSRSTAALFPGEMIDVHVASRPGKGQSKSFQTQAPLQPQKTATENAIATAPRREGQVDRAHIRPSLQFLTQRYFEELNAYANRLLRESPETN